MQTSCEVLVKRTLNITSRRRLCQYGWTKTLTTTSRPYPPLSAYLVPNNNHAVVRRRQVRSMITSTSGLIVSSNVRDVHLFSPRQNNVRHHFYSTTTLVEKTNDNNDDAVVVYESPFGNLVSRLRFISLMTAIAGSLGLPAVIAIKGTIPSGGFLALCLSFGTGTIASTAAIHYVFSPYVFAIERIPVRKCHYTSKAKTENANLTSQKEKEETEHEMLSSTPSSTSTTKPFMYKAITKSLFLTQIETVFDPNVDSVTKYKGFTKPLCNLVIRDQTHLFVHTEYVYDNALRDKVLLPLFREDDDKNAPGQAPKRRHENEEVSKKTRLEREADKDDERFLF